MKTKCQSCGMPFAKDSSNRGTEENGDLNDSYCSYCYEAGAFLHPNFTVSHMQDHCIAQLKKKGVPRFLGWLLTRGLPKLDRWSI